MPLERVGAAGVPDDRPRVPMAGLVHDVGEIGAALGQSAKLVTVDDNPLAAGDIVQRGALDEVVYILFAEQDQ